MTTKQPFTFLFIAAGIVALAIVFASLCAPTSPPLAGPSTISQGTILVQGPNASATPSEDQDLVGGSTLTSLFSLPAPFVIQSHLPSLLLFEIIFETAGECKPCTAEASLHPDVLFRIIFRLIISPNAP